MISIVHGNDVESLNLAAYPKKKTKKFEKHLGKQDESPDIEPARYLGIHWRGDFGLFSALERRNMEIEISLLIHSVCY